MPKTIWAPDSSSLKPGSGATEGVLEKGVLGCPAYYPWAGLVGCEDMKAKDCTCVRIGFSLSWKASLATNYEDSFLCNRLYVTLDPPGVYINRRMWSGKDILITIVIQARILGFSHYDLVVDQLL